MLHLAEDRLVDLQELLKLVYDHRNRMLNRILHDRLEDILEARRRTIERHPELLLQFRDKPLAKVLFALALDEQIGKPALFACLENERRLPDAAASGDDRELRNLMAAPLDFPQFLNL